MRISVRNPRLPKFTAENRDITARLGDPGGHGEQGAVTAEHDHEVDLPR